MTKILIVEDELVIAEDMKVMLERLGYEVSGIAVSYHQAIKALSNVPPDIILIDINLGGEKDGIELAHYVNTNCPVPLIFATSNADSSTIDKAKKATPHGYLLKPFTSDDLYTSIEIAIAGYKKASVNTHKIKDAVFIKDGDLFVKVHTGDILWLMSDGNYTDVCTGHKIYVVRGTVKDILNELDEKFFRVHKSYVVNLEKIKAVGTTHLLINEQEIPIGKLYKEELMNRISMLR